MFGKNRDTDMKSHSELLIKRLDKISFTYETHQTVWSINESNSDSASEKIESLPRGSTFDDAKRIDGIFSKSKHTWSEVIEAFEKMQKNAKSKTISIKEIQITQPNIQSNKVKAMIENFDKLPPAGRY
jgi:hypothetical protein